MLAASDFFVKMALQVYNHLNKMRVFCRISNVKT